MGPLVDISIILCYHNTPISILTYRIHTTTYCFFSCLNILAQTAFIFTSNESPELLSVDICDIFV